ncbi:ABC transporter ATP-binding protein [Corynebacterium suicordis]|uniref:ABC transporter ATP-binding protein n=1 Tax=Corynebacterium suicordis DSM 45110 TaxID=1121369 RepID=A0ABR9ZJH8_9CORY|nr:ABC transporter ATP-binding protein [Corynebacterium suicordis]MBF4553591.1 ABC transporter ATP-binding protein [Corynebacterium suicordis DSM 45110]MDR6277435.1 ABC-2 type transport system ATP-binding protein [Corynebacterium suicordis]
MTEANHTPPAASDAPEVLQLRGVRKSFGENTAVDGLDLTLHRGEVLALLGPNGAGKTTTVEMCEGFLVPDSGTVRVLGMDPAHHTDEVRSRIGVMLQGGGAYPGVRVGEMLELVASYSRNPLDTEWLLETVGLASNKKTPYRRLSGGQQQRLSLACALVGRPELIFLDEPTAGLDAQSRLVVWDLVRSLKRDGVTVVLTTHLMDEAEALADQVVIIDRGTVVAEGTPAQLTSGNAAETRSQHVVSLMVDGPLDVTELRQELTNSQSAAEASIEAQQEDTNHPGGQHVWKITMTELTPQTIADIAAAVARQGLLLQRLEVDKQSLEDVFLSITGREIR